MEHQNQILQTLRAPESQARLERIVAQEALNNRAAVGRRVCAEFGFCGCARVGATGGLP